jgi:hypothetical protein
MFADSDKNAADQTQHTHGYLVETDMPDPKPPNAGHARQLWKHRNTQCATCGVVNFFIG